ncbi:MAG: alpha/beta hydrolase [Alphaproteobacteria bacterium]|nr:alpha/beta hydrolase [Alphaproteobacteria bacterium]MBV9418428.1 alpha/beta hydrolase [Alphaproteobacteria bacterium]MBV9540794.1 alpha/beta hydrolase [Alphaproteobacteria bacterium]MBV9904176.1 alpha/beta hydrolase [Alphaproteobacteria bacterium]
MSKTVDLFVKDWGRGKPLLFLHSWAVTNEIWQYQHEHFVRAGYRVVAYDRRGHGRSAQPGDGYDADTLADDLARVIDAHNLTGVTLIGHSMAAGEIVRYLSRHGSSKVARIVLAAPTTPFILKTADNPQGIDGAAFEGLRNIWRADFPKWMADNSRPFFMPATSQAMIDWGMSLFQAPLHVAIACNEAMVNTDFRPDCQAVRVPTLILHGTKDASAAFPLTGKRTAELIPHAQLRAYEDAPHGLMLTHTARVNADIAAFLDA